MSRTEIISAFQAHMQATGRKATTVGQYALGDRKIYDRLISGGAVHQRTLDRLTAWLAEQEAVTE